MIHQRCVRFEYSVEYYVSTPLVTNNVCSKLLRCRCGLCSADRSGHLQAVQRWRANSRGASSGSSAQKRQQVAAVHAVRVEDVGTQQQAKMDAAHVFPHGV